MVAHFYFDSRMYTHLRLDGYPHAFSFARALLVLSYKSGSFTSKSKGKSLKNGVILRIGMHGNGNVQERSLILPDVPGGSNLPKQQSPKSLGCTICFSCFSDLIQLESI